MVTFEDVDAVLKHHTIDELYNNYSLRQQQGSTLNRRKALELNSVFSFYSSDSKKSIMDSFLRFLATTLSTSPEQKENLKHFLLKHGFNLSYELIQAIRFIDLFWNQDIKQEQFEFFLQCFFTIDDFKTLTDKGILCLFASGEYPFYEAFSLLNHGSLPKSERRNYCHDMTADELLISPDFYGAYYYIPYEFQGYAEHSVIIDKNKSMVYDLAQNVAFPLEIWQKYYPYPAFSIQGWDFITLREQAFEKYECKIDMWLLEEIRRIRKK